MRRAGLVAALLLAALLPVALGARKGGSQGKGTADRDMRNKRSECEKGQCSGFVNEVRASCVYECISQECFQEIYSKDLIEEGEVDTERSRQFAQCYRKVFKRQKDEALEQERRAKKEARQAGSKGA